MTMARVLSGMRPFVVAAVLAAGLAVVTAVPTPAETDLAPALPACGIDPPASDEPWAAPPERGRPGEPY